MCQTSAEDRGARILELLLQAKHELNKKLAVAIHGPAHIAEKNHLSLSLLAFLPGKINQIHAVFLTPPERSPKMYPPPSPGRFMPAALPGGDAFCDLQYKPVNFSALLHTQGGYVSPAPSFIGTPLASVY